MLCRLECVDDHYDHIVQITLYEMEGLGRAPHVGQKVQVIQWRVCNLLPIALVLLRLPSSLVEGSAIAIGGGL